MNARTLSGLDALEAISDLLQRRRAAHPTWGTFEAADMQWSWRKPRPSDALEQLFWFDADEQPIGAAYAISGGDWTLLHVVTLAEADATWVHHVVERGIVHADRLNLRALRSSSHPRTRS